MTGSCKGPITYWAVLFTCFFKIWTEVLFIQEVSGVFLDTDELKITLRARKVSRDLRETGPWSWRKTLHLYALIIGQLVLAGKGVKVNDDKWHWVEFSRWRREVALKIDHRTRAGGEMPGKSSQLNVGLEHKVYLAGGPRNVFRKSESKQNFSGYLQEFYFRHMKVFDSIVPSITDRRFVKVGTVIDGAIILDGSASGCFPAGDDEDEDCRSTAAATPPGMTRGGPSRPRVDFSKGKDCSDKNWRKLALAWSRSNSDLV